jgi:hypothetical protein
MVFLELQSTRLSWDDDPVETTTGKQILDAIQRRATDRWGEKWLVELVKAYVKIAIAKGDEGATVVNRRSHIERAFRSGNCKLDTALALAAAVDCKFQMVCTNFQTVCASTEVLEF